MAQIHRSPEQWLDLEFYKGATFSLQFTYRERDSKDIIPLDGADVYMQVRDSDGELLHEASTDNLQVTTNADGQVEIAIPSAETALFAWKEAAYDIFLVRPGGTFTDVVARGCAVVKPSITEAP